AYEAMAYQIAKEIGSMGVVLSGNVDAIVLTGGLAYGKSFIEMFSERVACIADIIVVAGVNEFEDLTEVTISGLHNEEKPKIYPTNLDIKERTTYVKRV